MADKGARTRQRIIEATLPLFSVIPLNLKIPTGLI